MNSLGCEDLRAEFCSFQASQLGPSDGFDQLSILCPFNKGEKIKGKNRWDLALPAQFIYSMCEPEGSECSSEEQHHALKPSQCPHCGFLPFSLSQSQLCPPAGITSRSCFIPGCGRERFVASSRSCWKELQHCGMLWCSLNSPGGNDSTKNSRNQDLVMGRASI